MEENRWTLSNVALRLSNAMTKKEPSDVDPWAVSQGLSQRHLGEGLMGVSSRKNGQSWGESIGLLLEGRTYRKCLV